MSNQSIEQKTKDTPIRSISKAISWRLIASGTTFIITFVVFRNYTEQSLNQVLQTASYITGIELVAKLIIYYLHERLWTNITWGKNWREAARRRIKRNKARQS